MTSEEIKSFASKMFKEMPAVLRNEAYKGRLDLHANGIWLESDPKGQDRELVIIELKKLLEAKFARKV